MIILEGPNKSGKTALAAKLAKHLDWDVHKFTNIPETIDDFDWQVKKSLELLGTCTIQDRCPMISDFIYAEHNMPRAAFDTLTRVRQLIANPKAIIIYCNHDAEKSEIAGKYYRFFQFAKSDEYLTYDYKKDDYFKLLDSIRDLIWI